MGLLVNILLLFAVIFGNWGNTAYAKPMRITATSWLVANNTGNIITGENTAEKRSIASITKLMTVMVVLDANQDLSENLKPYTRKELIQLAIVKSNNQSAFDLCKHYPTGLEQCIIAMNEKAKNIGMTSTRFTDPTGLGESNVSTAEDLIKLVLTAQHYPEIVAASKMSEVKIRLKKRWLIFNNTNPIIGKRHNFVVSKTGFINASGGCIVMMLDTDIGRKVIVVLGSKNTHTRIPEAEFIAKNF